MRLNTPNLVKRLKQHLKVLQSAVAAGAYVIDPDGSLYATDVVVHPDDYSNRMNVDNRGAAAEGSRFVLLDTTRKGSGVVAL